MNLSKIIDEVIKPEVRIGSPSIKLKCISNGKICLVELKNLLITEGLIKETGLSMSKKATRLQSELFMEITVTLIVEPLTSSFFL